MRGTAAAIETAIRGVAGVKAAVVAEHPTGVLIGVTTDRTVDELLVLHAIAGEIAAGINYEVTMDGVQIRPRAGRRGPPPPTRGFWDDDGGFAKRRADKRRAAAAWKPPPPTPVAERCPGRLHTIYFGGTSAPCGLRPGHAGVCAGWHIDGAGLLIGRLAGRPPRAPHACLFLPRHPADPPQSGCRTVCGEVGPGGVPCTELAGHKDEHTYDPAMQLGDPPTSVATTWHTRSSAYPADLGGPCLSRSVGPVSRACCRPPGHPGPHARGFFRWGTGIRLCDRRDPDGALCEGANGHPGDHRNRNGDWWPA